MNQLFNVTFIILSVLFLTESAKFNFGDPTYFGSGCDDETVEIVIASDGKSWSVLFSDFIAETDGDSLFDRKACNLAVTLNVDSSKQIGVYKTEYRGFTFGPSEEDTSSASFHAEMFFAGDTGFEEDKTFNNDREDFYIAQQVDDDDITYCECGASTIFRINTSITAEKGDAAHEDVIIGIDSADQTKYYKYYVRVRSC